MKNFKSIVLFLSFLSLAGALTACNGTQGITAKDVKDKESLRAFVHAARDHLRNDYEQAIVDFRKEGPWKHKEVYLSIMDSRGKIVLHAGIRTFEDQTGPILRDVDTGEPIGEKLLEAGFEKGGGFVEYTFDNPATSAKDPSKKIAYVIPFRKRGEQRENFIVISGFHPGVQ